MKEQWQPRANTSDVARQYRHRDINPPARQDRDTELGPLLQLGYLSICPSVITTQSRPGLHSLQSIGLAKQQATS